MVVVVVSGASVAGGTVVRGGRLLGRFEIAAQVVLGPGGDDARAPELERDEEQDQEPNRHQDAADRRDRPSHGRQDTDARGRAHPR